jgi:membrane dipeptidase
MLPRLVDLHEDISLYYCLAGALTKFGLAEFSVDLERRHGDIPKYRRANVRLVVASIAALTPSVAQSRVDQLSKGYGIPTAAFRIRSPTLLAQQHMATYLDLSRRHADSLKIVLSTRDLNDLDRDERIGFLIAMEGAEPLEDVEDLELFYRLGLRSLQFAWNFDNKYCASCMSAKDYGLTGDGERLVQLCNELGVIIDISHASKKTTMEIIAQSKLPVIASHANARTVWEHIRNLDDEQLEALKTNGGVIGVNLVWPSISERPSLSTVADHIIYLLKRFGEDMCAIGTDYFGLLDHPEPEGLEDITKFAGLWNELVHRGMSRSAIEKVSGSNALRAIETNAQRWK